MIPHLTDGAIEFLSNYLNKKSEVLEFGSGDSTLWFAEHCKNVISVEHKEEWLLYTSNLVKDKDNAFIMFHPANNIGKTDKTDKDYSFVCDLFPDYKFDFILVDGRNRVECFLKSFRILKRGGILMLDNSERDEYKPIFDKFKLHQWSHSEQEGKNQANFGYPNWKTSWMIK